MCLVSSGALQTLLLLREKLTVTSIAAKVVPSIMACSYELRRLLLVALTAHKTGRRSKPIQCPFTSRFVLLHHFERGRHYVLVAGFLKDAGDVSVLGGL